MPIKIGPDVKPGEATIEILERKTIYKGWGHFEDITYRQRTFDGAWSDPTNRQTYTPSGPGEVAAALAYDPVKDVLVLNEEFRVGGHLKGYLGWFLELSAGHVDKGEAPEQAVTRELMEETGLTAKRVEPIVNFCSCPSFYVERYYLYLAEVDSTQRRALTGEAHEGELIRTHVVPVSEALAMLDAGKIENSHLLIALHWFARHYEDIRKRWLA